MTRLTVRLVTLSLALNLCLVTAVSAQVPDADAKELRNYSLTVAAMKQFAAVTRNMMAAAQADPDLKTLSDIETALRREPMMQKALASAGMTPREYAKFSLAFFQAAMIHGLQKSGMVKPIPKDLEATVNLENIKFFDTHQAEIAALMAEFKPEPQQ